MHDSMIIGGYRKLVFDSLYGGEQVRNNTVRSPIGTIYHVADPSSAGAMKHVAAKLAGYVIR